jgi:hypothetical protein
MLKLLAASTLPLVLTACTGGDPPAPARAEARERSLAGVFVDAMVDELRGAPSQSALSELAEFSEAGVSFKYPALLRATVDRDSYPSWSVERGDFELELHAPKYTMEVGDYLEALAEAMASDSAPSQGPMEGRSVRWCGQETTGVLYRFTFLGDPQIYEGFDLPASSSGARFMVFGDMRKGNADWSETALATMAAVDKSIQCKDNAAPVPPSTN